MTTKLIKGRYLILGKQPDGDSVRFVPDHPEHLDDLYRRYRMELSG